MEISPERKDTIENFLSLIMGQDEAQRFANLGEAVRLIKQQQSCWQAPVSIGVHAAILHLADADDADKALLQDLIGHTLEPLEALLKSLTAKTSEKTPEDELARLLFHTRFGLGFLLFASGDEERAKTLLHEMASIQDSFTGFVFRSGAGIVTHTADMRWGKFLTFLLMQEVYEAEEDYEEELYFATQAIACSPGREFNKPIFESAFELIDSWATECEETDRSAEFDCPSVYWAALFAEVAEMLSACQEADSTGVLPNNCEVETAQFWAWKFGQVAGRLAVNPRWRENHFDTGLNVLRRDPVGIDEIGFQRGADKIIQACNAVCSLLCEYAPGHDWEKARQRYVSMWEGSYTYSGMSLPEISPDTDLYWAMRIGFADKILESTQKGVLAQVPPEPPPIIRDIENIKDIVTTIALRQVKEQHGRPPSPSEVRQFIEQQLRVVWSELPARVINPLTKAERYYRAEVNDDDAKVWFHKAVEASLDCCLVEPLSEFMRKRGYKQIAVCFSPPRGVEHKSSMALRKLALREWADVLEMLAPPPHKGLATLGVYDLKPFMDEHLGGPRWPDLRPLATSLRLVHELRSGAAHYEEATSRYGKEKWELEQMRSLVLGIGEDSVIAQLFRLLSPTGRAG